MTGTTRNLAASVRDRLLNRARRENLPFGELLQRYGIERFLYRLGLSGHKERFVLKGGAMLVVWHGDLARATRDVDFLGIGANSTDELTRIVQEICGVEVPDDGIVFDAGSVAAEEIMEAAQYRGVRVSLRGLLGQAVVPIQLDVGFGDVVIPRPIEAEYPTLLDFPSPLIKLYTKETAVAEKLEAMTRLGTVNSRMKDFYDIWFLSRTTEFDGETLAKAVTETFKRRETSLREPPSSFEAGWASEERQKAQWSAFGRRLRVQAPELSELTRDVVGFLAPVLVSCAEGRPFKMKWVAPGPWRPGA